MSIQIIKEVVEQHFDIDITKNTRKRHYVEARAMYFNLARDYTRMSLSVIGKTVYRDHTTVLYFLKELRDWMLHDYRLKQDYDTINKRVQDAIHANPEEFKTAVTLEGFYETQYKRLKELTEQINQDQLTIS